MSKKHYRINYNPKNRSYELLSFNCNPDNGEPIEYDSGIVEKVVSEEWMIQQILKTEGVI